VIHRLQLYCIFCLISFKDSSSTILRVKSERSFPFLHYGKGCVYDLFPRARSLVVFFKVEAFVRGSRLWNTP